MKTDKILGLKIQYELDNISDLKEICVSNFPHYKMIGIYYLFDENKELVYIGKSTASIYNRLKNHIFDEYPHPSNYYANRFSLHKRNFYKYLAYSEIPRHYIHAIEMLLIQKFRPKFNQVHNKEFEIISFDTDEYEIEKEEMFKDVIKDVGSKIKIEKIPVKKYHKRYEHLTTEEEKEEFFSDVIKNVGWKPKK